MSKLISSSKVEINGIDDGICKVEYYQGEKDYYGLIIYAPSGNSVTASKSIRTEPSDTLEGAAYNVRKYTSSSEFSRWIREPNFQQ